MTADVRRLVPVLSLAAMLGACAQGPADFVSGDFFRAPPATARPVLAPDEREDLPQREFVQITIITGRGRRRACIPTPAFWGQEPSTVVDIIGAAQDLISAIREAQTRP